MQQLIRVLMIEDDAIWAIKVESMLDNTIYKVVGIASNISTAMEMINGGYKPDIIISDVMLYGDSIYDFLIDSELLNLRWVFMSFHTTDSMFEPSKKIHKSIFLVKPFHKNTLISAIDNIFKIDPLTPQKTDNYITFTGKLQKNKRVYLSEITRIQALGNYSAAFTNDLKKYVKKHTLSKIKLELDVRFIQIHKSHIINVDYINRINLGNDFIVVNNQQVPIGRVYRKNLNEYIEKEN